MRRFFTLALFAGLVGAASIGCGGGKTGSNNGGSGGTGGGTGGTGGTGGSTTTTTTTTTTGTTTPMDCTGVINDATCGACGEGSCCDELSACKAVDGCDACLNTGDCATQEAVDAAQAAADCLQTNCNAECFAAPGTCARYCCNDADCGTGTCDKTILNGVTDVGVCVDAASAAACDAPATSPSGGTCGAAFDCNPITNEGCDAAGGEACDLSAGGFQCFGPPNDTAICDACDNGQGPFCVPGHTCVAAP